MLSVITMRGAGFKKLHKEPAVQVSDTTGVE
jgi:hypothetical protein